MDTTLFDLYDIAVLSAFNSMSLAWKDGLSYKRPLHLAAKKKRNQTKSLTNISSTSISNVPSVPMHYTPPSAEPHQIPLVLHTIHNKRKPPTTYAMMRVCLTPPVDDKPKACAARREEWEREAVSEEKVLLVSSSMRFCLSASSYMSVVTPRSKWSFECSWSSRASFCDS